MLLPSAATCILALDRLRCLGLIGELFGDIGLGG